MESVGDQGGGVAWSGGVGGWRPDQTEQFASNGNSHHPLSVQKSVEFVTPVPQRNTGQHKSSTMSLLRSFFSECPRVSVLS